MERLPAKNELPAATLCRDEHSVEARDDDRSVVVRDPVRRHEGASAVTRAGNACAARERGHYTGRGDFANGVVARVGDVDVAARVRCDTRRYGHCGVVQLSRWDIDGQLR
jgi:hypothetical protein